MLIVHVQRTHLQSGAPKAVEVKTRSMIARIHFLENGIFKRLRVVIDWSVRSRKTAIADFMCRKLVISFRGCCVYDFAAMEKEAASPSYAQHLE
jgi:hypothetical protein